MGIESICFKEAKELVKRDQKYWLLVAHLYAKSMLDPKTAKIMRAAYFFCRHIDDVLDGDRLITKDPKAYIEEIKDAMRRDNRVNEIATLYRYVITELETRKRANDEPEQDFERVINAMVFDYERGQRTEFFSRDRIEQYYDDTFIPVLNISLMIAEASVRGEDIPEIAYSMGHLYSIRDMKKDLAAGIINIPYEEIEKAEFDTRRIISRERIRKNLVLKQWMDNEVRVYGEEVKKWKEEAYKKVDGGTQRVCSPLLAGMETFCRNYWKESTYK